MLLNYIKLTFKVLMRRKMFTFINLFGIFFSLTILLAATTIYTLMVVSNPVQKNLSRTLFLKQVTLRNPETQSMRSGPTPSYFIEKCIFPLKKDVERISFCSFMCIPITIYLNDSRIDIDTKETDENFWKMNSFKFVEGHPYDFRDIQDNPHSLIICKSLKERIFGKNPAVGKSLFLYNVRYKIMGVVEDVSSIYLFAYSQVWFPYNYQSYYDQVRNKNFNIWTYQVAVEMKSKNSFEPIRSQFKQEISKLPVPEHFKVIEAKLESSSEMVFNTIGDRGPGVPLIIGFILLFSLIPLLNLTNLTVSRIFERSSEIGVRKAFGATKRQMALQFVYENILITLMGGILGFLGAWFLIKGLDASGLIQVGKVNFSLLVFASGLIVILIFGMVSGFYPALKMSKLHIVDSLKGGAK